MLIKIEAKVRPKVFWDANNKQIITQTKVIWAGVHKWIKPPPSFYKANVDTSFNKQEFIAGIDVIIRLLCSEVGSCT